MARLLVIHGSVAEGAPTSLEIAEGELTIGRSRDNDLTLNEPSVSRHHAVIIQSATGTVLRDLGSANGTFINKLRITEQPLHDGDTILLGRAELRFEAPAEVSDATIRVDTARDVPAPPRPASPPPQVPGAQAPPVAPPAVPPPVSPAVQPQATPTRPPAAPPVSARPVAPPPVAPPPVAPPPAAPPPAAPPQAPQPMAPPAAPPPSALPPAAQQAPLGAPQPAPPFGITAAPAELEYAGFWSRLGAYLIDMVIIFVVELVIMIPTGLIARIAARKAPGIAGLVMALAYLIVAIFSIWYLLHFWNRDGATPGKKLLHLKVVREDGVEPMGYGTAVLRMLGYMLSSIIFCIGYLMIAFTDRKRGLHDMIAKTVVIKTR